MILYIMKTEEVIVYLGYSVKEGKGSTGPNGTYASSIGFIKDKSKALEGQEIFIGKKKVEVLLKPDVIIEVPFINTYLVKKEDKDKVTVPDVIRKYLLGLTYVEGEFDKVLPYTKFFNPKRVSSELIVGSHIFYRPVSKNSIGEDRYYVITNPPGEIGRNASTALYSIVDVKEELPYVRELVERYNKVLDDYDNPVCVYVKNINSVVPSMLLRDFGVDAFTLTQTDFHRGNLSVLKLGEDYPLIEMINPPNLAFRAFERLDIVDVRLNKYITKKSSNRDKMIDISDMIWEKDGSLNKDIKPGKKLKVLNVDSMPIPFIPDVDIPSTNSLKKLGKNGAKCFLILHDEDSTFAYSFILDTNEGIGIYYSYFSNRVFKKALKKK